MCTWITGCLVTIQVVLVSSSCYNKCTINFVTYKYQTLTSHSSGGWGVQDQGASRCGLVRTYFLIDSHLLTVTSLGISGKGTGLGDFSKSTNSVHEPSWPNHLLKAPSSNSLTCSSVQFSHSVMSDSLRSHEAQQARPPCPTPTPGVHSDSCPLSQWYHPTISSSIIPFSSHP